MTSAVLTRARTAPLVAHAAALALVLLVLLPFVGTHTVFYADEGSALAQADQLVHDRGWLRPDSFPVADPNHETFPLFNAPRGAGGLAPLGEHPVYSALIVPFDALGEMAGTMLLSIAATVAAAVLAALLARRIKPGTEIAALWATGLASPLFFDAYLVAGHTLVALCGVAAALAVARLIAGERVREMTAVALVFLALGALVRNEGVLFAIAVGIALAAHGAWRRHRAQVVAGVLAVVTAGACYVVDARLRALVLGPAKAARGFTIAEATSRGVGGRLFGAFTTLLLPSYTDFGVGDILLVIGGVAAIVAAVIVRRRPDDREGALLFATISVACFVARLFAPASPVPGIVWAFPLLAIGIVLLPRGLVRQPVVTVLGGGSVLFAGAVLATQYSSGGTHEWGWRYFAAAVPVVTPIAVAAIASAGSSLSRVDRRRLAGLVVAGSLAVSVLAVLALRTTKQDNAQIVAGIRAAYVATPATDGGKPVVLTTQWGTVDRFSWRTIDETRWLVIDPGKVNAQLDPIFDRITSLGVGQLTFVTSNADRDLPFVERHGDITSTEQLPNHHVVVTVRLR